MLRRSIDKQSGASVESVLSMTYEYLADTIFNNLQDHLPVANPALMCDSWNITLHYT